VCSGHLASILATRGRNVGDLQLALQAAARRGSPTAVSIVNVLLVPVSTYVVANVIEGTGDLAGLATLLPTGVCLHRPRNDEDTRDQRRRAARIQRERPQTRLRLHDILLWTDATGKQQSSLRYGRLANRT
jgi:hypothetical protein